MSEDFCISSDPHNFILETRRRTKKGREYWRPIAFHATLESVLNALTDKKLKTLGRTTLEEISSHLAKIRAENRQIGKQCRVLLGRHEKQSNSLPL